MHMIVGIYVEVEMFKDVVGSVCFVRLLGIKVLAII
jgi:hypothetical protein